MSTELEQNLWNVRDQLQLKTSFFFPPANTNHGSRIRNRRFAHEFRWFFPDQKSLRDFTRNVQYFTISNNWKVGIPFQ